MKGVPNRPQSCTTATGSTIVEYVYLGVSFLPLSAMKPSITTTMTISGHLACSPTPPVLSSGRPPMPPSARPQ